MALDPFISGFEYGRSNADAPDSFFGIDDSPLRSSDHDALVLFVSSNRPPAAVTLPGASLAENRAIGSLAGTLGAADPDTGEEHVFSLVPGDGDDHNGSFEVEGVQLRTLEVFDFEIQPAPGAAAEDLFILYFDGTNYLGRSQQGHA